MESLLKKLNDEMTVLNSHATRFTEKKVNKSGSDVRKSAQTLKALLQELRKAVLEQQKKNKDARKKAKGTGSKKPSKKASKKPSKTKK